ncbi:MAG TPA: hypothetical protein VFN26_13195 [Candidatus Acidoferrum sp.]|nr:hypothetical protein [Candidatus Acidoferrum sp.]
MSAESKMFWLTAAALVVGLVALIPAYFIFWDRPDLVYEVQLVNIPLPESLGSNLPNVLILLKIQNTGHRPSENIQGNITLNGKVLYYEVKGPNTAFGPVEATMSKDSRIDLKCSRLAQGEYPINVSAWVKGNLVEPDAAFADSSGAAQKVKSTEAETRKVRSYWYASLGAVGGFLSFSLGALVVLRLFVKGAAEAILRGYNR